MDDTNASTTESLRWRFWFLVSLSGFLIVTFAFYLPARFLAQAQEDHGHMDMSGDMSHMEGMMDGASLAKLPLRTPATRIENLPYVMNGDVKEFRLEAQEFRWEYTPGKWIHVWGYNGQIPGPTIRAKEGERVRVIVKNSLPDATTVHWHGIDTPWLMDGVPGVTQKPIAPGNEFTYEFVATPSGTRWYHTHGKSDDTSAQQLDMGLSGAFIIESKNERYAADHEYTWVLDEWNVQNGANSALSHVHGAGGMPATPTYNMFTINGNIAPSIPAIPIKLGEKILVRFVNAGTAEIHPMHLHGHNFQVVARDGNYLKTPEMRTVIGLLPGETVDILIEGNNPGIWMFHCHQAHHAGAGMMATLSYEGYSIDHAIAASAPMNSASGSMMMAMDGHTDHAHDESPIPASGHAHEPGTAPHEDAPLAGPFSPVWWRNLFVSLVAMALLSFAIKKYINP